MSGDVGQAGCSLREYLKTSSSKEVFGVYLHSYGTVHVSPQCTVGRRGAVRSALSLYENKHHTGRGSEVRHRGGWGAAWDRGGYGNTYLASCFSIKRVVVNGDEWRGDGVNLGRDEDRGG